MPETDKKPLVGKEIVLCVSGGIACYKAADLTSKLVQADANVHVAMTEAATRFVGALTFQALSRNAVFTSTWQSGENYSSRHTSLTELADLIIVAPATADIIGKMACGIADDLVSTLYIASTGTCEVLIAPAMNTRMWNSPAVQANIAKLKSWGVHVAGPAEGNVACGTSGTGRMLEPKEIMQAGEKLLVIHRS